MPGDATGWPTEGHISASSVWWARWHQFDRRWNDMKAPVEDMQMKLARLERMQAHLPAREQREINASQPLITEIAANTHDLRVLIDKPHANLAGRRLQRRSLLLAREAGRLAQTA